MYEQFYGMSYNPFKKDIKEKDAYVSRDLKEMISRLEYLNNIRGIALFTAEPGRGKTFALRYFKKKVNPNLTKVIYICHSSIKITDFYRQFSIALGLEPCSRKSDMFKNIKEYLESISENKHIHHILMIDEAHHLNSDILRDLKMLMNFTMDSKDCFSLVLVGLPVLNSTLSKQIYQPLRQRIIINYNFWGISEEEAKEYITSRFSLVGASPSIIDDNAIKAMYSSCSKSIRVLNNIITKTLLAGAHNDQTTIDTDLVMSVVNELSFT